MIRKNTVSLILTVLVALDILVSLQAVDVARHGSTVDGSHPSVILASDNPTPTPATNNSNPSGGGNGGG